MLGSRKAAMNGASSSCVWHISARLKGGWEGGILPLAWRTIPDERGPSFKSGLQQTRQTAGDHCYKQVEWEFAKLDSSDTSGFLVVTVPVIKSLSSTLSPQMVYGTSVWAQVCLLWELNIMYRIKKKKKSEKINFNIKKFFTEKYHHLYFVYFTYFK